TRRPRQKGKARRHTPANKVCGSQRQREWRKYSLDQLRCWRPWVQMMRDRQRRPTQTKAPKAWRVARRKVRDWGKLGAQSATISDQAVNRVIGPPGVKRRCFWRCAGNDRRGQLSW